MFCIAMAIGAADGDVVTTLAGQARALEDRAGWRLGLAGQAAAIERQAVLREGGYELIGKVAGGVLVDVLIARRPPVRHPHLARAGIKGKVAAAVAQSDPAHDAAGAEPAVGVAPGSYFGHHWGLRLIHGEDQVAGVACVLLNIVPM